MTEYLIWLIIIVALFSIPVAIFAKRKGRSPEGYFLLSLITSPIVAIIVLLILGDSDKLRLEKVKQEEELRISIRKDSGINNNEIPSANKYEALEKLGELFQKGIISKEEFEEEKKKVLSESNSYQNKKLIAEPIPIKLDENLISVVSYVKELIDKEKSKGLFGKSIRDEMLAYLESWCLSKENCIQLIQAYHSQYKSDLIEDLKKLSTSYVSIRETLKVFIDFGIIEEKYPHEIKK